MTPQEETLYNALLVTFNGNLAFLAQYDEELFYRISALSDAISSGDYTERHFLEFIKENGDFDIYDSKLSRYVYDKNPKKWNNTAVANTNFDLKNTISLLSQSPFLETPTDLTKLVRNTTSIEAKKTSIDVFHFTSILKENFDQNSKFKKFDKFIFLGTLLGRHIPKLVEKIGSKKFIVCESNLEIFRLSLFVCDYSILARDGRSVIFSIMEEDEQVTNKLEKYFVQDGLNTVFFKFFSTNSNMEHYFDLIINVSARLNPFSYDYNRMIKTFKDGCSAIKEYQTIYFSKIKEDEIFAGGKPVLFLGAGPSLSSNIDWVIENQNKFIIVAMAATLKRLSEHNIIPDIITSADANDINTAKQFNISNQHIIEHPIKIISTNTNSMVFDILKSDPNKLFLYEVLSPIIPHNIAISGFSIGEITLNILLLLNTQDIYLLGIDLALDQTTGSTHDSTHVSSRNVSISDDDLFISNIINKSSYSTHTDTIKVKGNFLDQVVTTRLLNSSLHTADAIISKYKKPHQNIYNLSNNGAFLTGSIPKKSEDINTSGFNIIDKKSLTQEMINYLKLISLDYHSIDNFELLQEQLQPIETLIEDAKNKKNLDIKDEEALLENAKDFFIKAIDLELRTNYATLIYSRYYSIVYRYFIYHFNNKSFKANKQKISEINYIFFSQLELISKKYRDILKDFVIIS